MIIKEVEKTLQTLLVPATCIIGFKYINVKYGIDAVIIVAFSIIIGLIEMKEVE